jgi:molecular chaperone HscB
MNQQANTEARTVAPASGVSIAAVTGTETNGADGLTACWSCRGPVAPGAAFCDTCNAVQPPGQLDHFQRLGLARGFALDPAEIDRRYFALQRRLHPDRFATRSARERALSQQQATSLNEAYETLRDPLERAGYLLRLNGIVVNADGCNTLTDPVLLSEAMEMREALAEAEDRPAVEAIARRTGEDIGTCVGELGRAFAADDLETAGKLTTRLKYLTKLAEEARLHRLKRAAGDR